MRVCYVLAYRDPYYIRSQSLIAALKQIPGVEVILAVNDSRGLLRYVETLRLLLRIRREQRPDVYVLGFRGHEIAWLVRWLTRGKPLLFDALMSPYAALAEERKAGAPGALLARLWRPCEAHALRCADLVLTDTALHAACYSREFVLAPEKILPLPVGAVEPSASAPPTPFKPAATELCVLFYGSFLPLHGVEFIVGAAAQVKDLPLRFDYIGGSVAQAHRLRALCARHGVMRWTHRVWVPFEQLIAHEIPDADLCLGGPFGGTPQARRVVTGKTSQCLALGKATVVGQIDTGHGFVNKHNCLLVPQADVHALAAALRWAFENRAALPTLGAAGQRLYNEQLSVATIARTLGPTMHSLGSLNRTPSSDAVR